ncbi:MAG TPA: oligosaccharide flippase family protein, partial [Candidatus Limnocylindria bacterium]|nr:oligosaccharide flippase family protein [Candidatus Limnocylindria bacterium]
MTAETPEVDLPDLEQRPEVVAIGQRGRAAIIQLTLRTGLLRVVSLIGTVLLARILAPADFGAFAVIVLLTSALTPFGDLGLGATLIQRRETPTEREMATVFTAQQIMWLMLLALAWLAAPLIRLAGPGMPADAEWMIRVAAIAVYVNQTRSVPVAMMSRILRFGPLAAIEVMQQITYAVVAVGLALSGAGVWSFVIALLAQFSLGALLTYLAWGHRPHIGLDRTALRGLMGFGVTFQATYVLSIFREAVVPLFGGLAGGVTAIGYLNFGQRFGRLLGSVDEIINRVAFPAFSRIQGDAERRARALVHIVETSSVVFGLVLGWAICVAPTLIEVAFSATWLKATPVFQLTAVAVLIGLPTGFMRVVAFSMGMARPIFMWSTISLVIMFAVFPPLLIAFGLVGGGVGFVVYAV